MNEPLEAVEATKSLTGTKARAPEPVSVEALSDPAKGARCELAAGMLVIGSHRDCDLVVRDPTVSKRHVSLELVDGAVRVLDLGSRNGTRFLGSTIQQAKVPVGGVLTIGKTELLIRPALQSALVSDREELCGLLGRSVAMRRLFAQMERVGPLEVTVVISGESGSGKEAVAAALHQLSPRSSGPFLTFDCGAANPNLVDSELFGHVSGAFTGAQADHLGLLERAEGGTLLLDAVTDLPLELQPKLLRFLEGRAFRPVGGADYRQSSVRVLATTTRPLSPEVEAGRFRADLYYRLAVAELRVPSLRERTEDIVLLATHFARQQSGVEVRLDSRTLASLHACPWPGNVRELKSAVERAFKLGQPFASEPATGAARAPAPYHAAREEMLDHFERDYVVALLEHARGNVSLAARASGLSRMQLYRLLEKHRLQRPCE